MKFNYSLDAPSPVLKYSGSWTPVASDDPTLSRYLNGTAMKTSTTGDTVQFSFNGTGVWVYGAKRSDHGNYSVILDTDAFELSGLSAGQDVFQALLFGSGNLTSGPHQITITNQGVRDKSNFDLDFIVWEGVLPENSKTKTFNNRDKQFEYLPGPSWWAWGYENNSYSGILYYTQSNSATFRFNFTGQSIALYGYIDTNHGNFSCSVDGVSRGVYTGYYPTKAFHQLICFGDNLDDGDHVLHVTNLPLSTNDGWFSIDYAEIKGTNPGRARHTGSSTHIGSIIGGVIGGLLFVALLAGLIVFFLRKRRDAKPPGRRVSRPVQHRDVFEIDGHPSGGGDHTLNSHVTPYDPYADSASTTPGAQSYVTEVLGSSQGTTPPNIDTPSSFGPSDSSSQFGSRRNRTTSNISSARYLAPQPERDAGPLLRLNESDIDDEDEVRAVGGPSLPPVYSSIIGVPPQSTALRDEKPVVRGGGLQVVGPRSDEDS